MSAIVIEGQTPAQDREITATAFQSLLLDPQNRYGTLYVRVNGKALPISKWREMDGLEFRHRMNHN